jgi:TetR/AcrR family transcriptional regulator, tetracycline repressor protein
MNTSRKLDATRLTKARIVAAAIALLNDEGLDGVSLRKLAGRLGVRAPSLYWHFPDKDALLAAVLEKIFNSCLDSVPASRNWQTWMRSFGRALWRKQGIRDFGRLITTTDIDATQLHRTRERIRSKLAGLDMPEAEAMRLQSSIQALVSGWSAFAHAPYAPALSRLFSFRKMAMNDVELLIVGAEQSRRDIATAAPRSRRNADALRGRTLHRR